MPRRVLVDTGRESADHRRRTRTHTDKGIRTQVSFGPKGDVLRPYVNLCLQPGPHRRGIYENKSNDRNVIPNVVMWELSLVFGQK